MNTANQLVDKVFSGLWRGCGWLFGGILWLATAASSLGDLVFTESDADRIVNAGLGEKIFFDLSGNPSTGYSWVMASTNGDSVVFTGEATYHPDNPDTAGGSGIYQYPLLATQMGPSYFEFHYRKAWDPQSTLKFFTITINVTNAAPRLTLSRGETGLVLSWPMAGNEGYYLEGATNLAAPQWQALNVLVRSDDTHYWAEVKPTGSAIYYRLRH